MFSAESMALATSIAFADGATSRDEEILELRRALFALAEAAVENGMEAFWQVRGAKELLRCVRQECGLAGACDGRGTDESPCPLRSK